MVLGPDVGVAVVESRTDGVEALTVHARVVSAGVRRDVD